MNFEEPFDPAQALEPKDPLAALAPIEPGIEEPEDPLYPGSMFHDPAQTHFFDGDTFQIGDQVHRLAYVDAVENSQGPDVAAAAKAAANSFFIPEGEYRLRRIGTDPYGRNISDFVDTEGRSLATHMVEQGYGKVMYDFRPEDNEHYNELLRAQTEAMKNRIGQHREDLQDPAFHRSERRSADAWPIPTPKLPPGNVTMESYWARLSDAEFDKIHSLRLDSGDLVHLEEPVPSYDDIPEHIHEHAKAANRLHADRVAYEAVDEKFREAHEHRSAWGLGGRQAGASLLGGTSLAAAATVDWLSSRSADGMSPPLLDPQWGATVAKGMRESAAGRDEYAQRIAQVRPELSELVWDEGFRVGMGRLVTDPSLLSYRIAQGAVSFAPIIAANFIPVAGPGVSSLIAATMFAGEAARRAEEIGADPHETMKLMAMYSLTATFLNRISMVPILKAYPQTMPVLAPLINKSIALKKAGKPITLQRKMVNGASTIFIAGVSEQLQESAEPFILEGSLAALGLDYDMLRAMVESFEAFPASFILGGVAAGALHGGKWALERKGKTEAEFSEERLAAALEAASRDPRVAYSKEVVDELEAISKDPALTNLENLKRRSLSWELDAEGMLTETGYVDLTQAQVQILDRFQSLGVAEESAEWAASVLQGAKEGATPADWATSRDAALYLRNLGVRVKSSDQEFSEAGRQAFRGLFSDMIQAKDGHLPSDAALDAAESLIVAAAQWEGVSPEDLIDSMVLMHSEVDSEVEGAIPDVLEGLRSKSLATKRERAKAGEELVDRFESARPGEEAPNTSHSQQTTEEEATSPQQTTEEETFSASETAEEAATRKSPYPAATASFTNFLDKTTEEVPDAKPNQVYERIRKGLLELEEDLVDNLATPADYEVVASALTVWALRHQARVTLMRNAEVKDTITDEANMAMHLAKKFLAREKNFRLQKRVADTLVALAGEEGEANYLIDLLDPTAEQAKVMLERTDLPDNVRKGLKVYSTRGPLHMLADDTDTPITVHSGGATGADTVFEKAATAAGATVRAHSFQGHKTSSKNKVVHTAEELAQADAAVAKAGKALGRSLRWSSNYVKNLMRRNYFQIKDSNQVIAVAALEGKSKVSGGTGWAVQMGIDASLPIYVFDSGQGKVTNQWYSYNYDTKQFQVSKPPTLSSSFAGIGTRSISKEGEAAIQELFSRPAQAPASAPSAPKVKTLGPTTTYSYGEAQRSAATHIYLFGDNLQGRGFGGQAQIRNAANAYGIPTKKKPSSDKNAYFTDAELAENMQAIDDAIAEIPMDGRIVVIPAIGEGRAHLRDKAPLTHQFLQYRLAQLKKALGQSDPTTDWIPPLGSGEPIIFSTVKPGKSRAAPSRIFYRTPEGFVETTIPEGTRDLAIHYARRGLPEYPGLLINRERVEGHVASAKEVAEFRAYQAEKLLSAISKEWGARAGSGAATIRTGKRPVPKHKKKSSPRKQKEPVRRTLASIRVDAQAETDIGRQLSLLRIPSKEEAYAMEWAGMVPPPKPQANFLEWVNSTLREALAVETFAERSGLLGEIVNSGRLEKKSVGQANLDMTEQVLTKMYEIIFLANGNSGDLGSVKAVIENSMVIKKRKKGDKEDSSFPPYVYEDETGDSLNRPVADNILDEPLAFEILRLSITKELQGKEGEVEELLKSGSPDVQGRRPSKKFRAEGQDGLTDDIRLIFRAAAQGLIQAAESRNPETQAQPQQDAASTAAQEVDSPRDSHQRDVETSWDARMEEELEAPTEWTLPAGDNAGLQILSAIEQSLMKATAYPKNRNLLDEGHSNAVPLATAFERARVMLTPNPSGSYSVVLGDGATIDFAFPPGDPVAAKVKLVLTKVGVKFAKEGVVSISYPRFRRAVLSESTSAVARPNKEKTTDSQSAFTLEITHPIYGNTQRIDMVFSEKDGSVRVVDPARGDGSIQDKVDLGFYQFREAGFDFSLLFKYFGLSDYTHWGRTLGRIVDTARQGKGAEDFDAQVQRLFLDIDWALSGGLKGEMQAAKAAKDPVTLSRLLEEEALLKAMVAHNYLVTGKDQRRPSFLNSGMTSNLYNSLKALYEGKGAIWGMDQPAITTSKIFHLAQKYAAARGFKGDTLTIRGIDHVLGWAQLGHAEPVYETVQYAPMDQPDAFEWGITPKMAIVPKGRVAAAMQKVKARIAKNLEKAEPGTEEARKYTQSIRRGKRTLTVEDQLQELVEIELRGGKVRESDDPSHNLHTSKARDAGILEVDEKASWVDQQLQLAKVTDGELGISLAEGETIIFDRDYGFQVARSVPVKMKFGEEEGATRSYRPDKGDPVTEMELFLSQFSGGIGSVTYNPSRTLKDSTLTLDPSLKERAEEDGLLYMVSEGVGDVTAEGNQRRKAGVGSFDPNPFSAGERGTTTYFFPTKKGKKAGKLGPRGFRVAVSKEESGSARMEGALHELLHLVIEASPAFQQILQSHATKFFGTGAGAKMYREFIGHYQRMWLKQPGLGKPPEMSATKPWSLDKTYAEWDVYQKEFVVEFMMYNMFKGEKGAGSAEMKALFKAIASEGRATLREKMGELMSSADPQVHQAAQALALFLAGPGQSGTASGIRHGSVYSPFNARITHVTPGSGKTGTTRKVVTRDHPKGFAIRFDTPEGAAIFDLGRLLSLGHKLTQEQRHSLERFLEKVGSPVAHTPDLAIRAAKAYYHNSLVPLANHQGQSPAFRANLINSIEAIIENNSGIYEVGDPKPEELRQKDITSHPVTEAQEKVREYDTNLYSAIGTVSTLPTASKGKVEPGRRARSRHNVKGERFGDDRGRSSQGALREESRAHFETLEAFQQYIEDIEAGKGKGTADEVLGILELDEAHRRNLENLLMRRPFDPHVLDYYMKKRDVLMDYAAQSSTESALTLNAVKWTKQIENLNSLLDKIGDKLPHGMEDDIRSLFFLRDNEKIAHYITVLEHYLPLRESVPKIVPQLLTQIWYINLMSAPSTHALNLVSSYGMLLYSVPHKSHASFYDWVLGKAKIKEREVYMTDSMALAITLFPGIGSHWHALKNAGTVLTQPNYIHERMSRLERDMNVRLGEDSLNILIHKALKASGEGASARRKKGAQILSVLANSPLRIMAAGDAFISTMAEDAKRKSHAMMLSRLDEKEAFAYKARLISKYLDKGFANMSQQQRESAQRQLQLGYAPEGSDIRLFDLSRVDADSVVRYSKDQTQSIVDKDGRAFGSAGFLGKPKVTSETSGPFFGEDGQLRPYNFFNSLFAMAMEEDATVFARHVTFQDELGSTAKALGAFRSKIPLGRVFFPFYNTLIQVALRGTEFVPGVGFGVGLYAHNPGNNVSTLMAKQVEGMVLAAVMLGLIGSFEVTGPPPDDRDERAAMYRTGRRPWSIKIGDSWVDYRRFEPFGLPLAAIATIEASHRKKLEAAAGDPDLEYQLGFESMLEVWTVVRDFGVQYTVGQGLQSGLYADEAESFDFINRSLASALIPYSSFFRSLNRMDGTIRQPKGFLEHIGQSIPFGNLIESTQAPPIIDVWGDEARIVNGIFREWLPLKWQPEETDQVERFFIEIEKYPSMPAPTRRIKVRDHHYVKLTDTQYRELIMEVGPKYYEAVEKMIARPRFGERTREQKADMLSKLQSRLYLIEQRRLAARLRGSGATLWRSVPHYEDLPVGEW